MSVRFELLIVDREHANAFFIASHFQQLEEELLELEVKMLGHVTKEHVRKWINEGRFLTGRQVAEEEDLVADEDRAVAEGDLGRVGDRADQMVAGEVQRLSQPCAYRDVPSSPDEIFEEHHHREPKSHLQLHGTTSP